MEAALDAGHLLIHAHLSSLYTLQDLIDGKLLEQSRWNSIPRDKKQATDANQSTVYTGTNDLRVNVPEYPIANEHH